jgi:hypothetical protein
LLTTWIGETKKASVSSPTRMSIIDKRTGRRHRRLLQNDENNRTVYVFNNDPLPGQSMSMSSKDAITNEAFRSDVAFNSSPTNGSSISSQITNATTETVNHQNVHDFQESFGIRPEINRASNHGFFLRSRAIGGGGLGSRIAFDLGSGHSKGSST